MRRLKPALKSIYGFLGQASTRSESGAQARIENVRKAMLSATPAGASSEQHSDIFRQIHFADSIEALWYSRSGLMADHSAERGERAAEQEMAGISRLFKGLLPEARGSGRAGNLRQ